MLFGKYAYHIYTSELLSEEFGSGVSSFDVSRNIRHNLSNDVDQQEHSILRYLK
jgi:hypothetical protein